MYGRSETSSSHCSSDILIVVFHSQLFYSHFSHCGISIPCRKFSPQPCYYFVHLFSLWYYNPIQKVQSTAILLLCSVIFIVVFQSHAESSVHSHFIALFSYSHCGISIPCRKFSPQPFYYFVQLFSLCYFNLMQKV